MDAARELLMRLIAEHREDMAHLSRGMGRNHAYLQQYLKRGTPRVLPAPARAWLGERFGIAPEHFLPETPPPERLPRPDPASFAQPLPPPFVAGGPRGNVDLTRLVPGDRILGRRDLPIYASAQGGGDGMTITPEPIDWVLRPEAVLHVKDAFGVYCVGDSMEPRINQGELVVVHPTAPPAKGDDVLLTATRALGAETLAMVKRLVKVDATHWVVRQFNPAREFRLARKEWQAAFKVVAIYPHK
jgi:hypothetical protein